MSDWDGKTERRQDVLLQARLERIEDQVSEIHGAIFGNGRPERGHIVRLDRLEQAKAVQDRHLLALWSALIMGAVKMLYDLMKP